MPATFCPVEEKSNMHNPKGSESVSNDERWFFVFDPLVRGSPELSGQYSTQTPVRP
jgi:hypothetical protein